MRTVIALIVAAIVLCPSTAQARIALPPDAAFRDETTARGLALGNDQACWVDIDNDGWADLITAGAVWRNNQGRSFTRFAEVGSVVAADFDNDGYVDLFSFSQMKLYRNNGGKGFSEVKLPALPPTVSRGACWGDFNGDGYVDLFIGGYEDWDRDITYPSMLLINETGKSFRLAWSDRRYRTRGVTACAFNQQGRLHIYLSNYRLQPNELLLNDGAGNFKEVAPQFNAVATSPGFEGGHSIGACWGDFDNDGLFDLFAGNFAHRDDRGDQPKSRFLRNLGPSAGYRFDDLGTCGVFYQESYASPAAADFDNDGLLDLYFTTVYGVASFNRPNFPVLYRNGGGFHFSDATSAAGLGGIPPTYQAAWADFNHDGYLDLVTGGRLYVNHGSGRHWLEVRLAGDGREVNRSAIGAQVRIVQKGRTLSRQVEAGTGEGNQNDLTLHFGLGEAPGSVDLQVTWPNGRVQFLRRVRVDRIMEVGYRRRETHARQTP